MTSPNANAIESNDVELPLATYSLIRALSWRYLSAHGSTSVSSMLEYLAGETYLP